MTSTEPDAAPSGGPADGTGNRVLICEPRPQLRRALQAILRASGYRVQTAVRGEEALNLAWQRRPAAVILDSELPDMDGIEVCRRLRRRDQMPIIILSGVDHDCLIPAFESGADDYVSTPFNPGELLVRLAARMRAAPSPLRVEADGLTIDLTARLVMRDGQAVHLTMTEFAVLRVLVTSNGTVSHRALALRVWGEEGRDARRRVRVHVSSLRAKLEGGKPRSVIVTDSGVGYQFAPRGLRISGAAGGPGPSLNM
jgi:two-component system, OmpR family, KDP operon response regulator KdpE